MKQRDNQYLTAVFINPRRAFNGDNKSELGTAAGSELSNISSEFCIGGCQLRGFSASSQGPVPEISESLLAFP